MSSLIYRLTDKQLCVAADTLMSTTHREPLKYATKILLLPHVRGVICGTGAGDLLLNWYLSLQFEIVVPDLPWLGEHAPARLAELAVKVRLPPDMKTTIYHFGWDHRVGRMVGQTFAAAEGFALREAHRECLVVKPGYPSAIEGAEDLIFRDGVAGFAEIMLRQRLADEKLPKDERAGIGGEVHFVEVTTDHIAQFLAYRFADYHQLYELMLRNARRFTQPPT